MANAYYHRFLTIRINHSYYKNGVTNNFSLVPFEETAGVLKHRRILFKQHEYEISFYYESSEQDSSNIATDLADLGLLHFELLNSNMLFPNYTANLPLNSGEILYVKNVPQLNEEPDDEEPSKPTELKIDFAPANTSTSSNAIGVLLLDCGLFVPENNPEFTYQLSFQARELIWEYQFVIAESRNININTIKISGILGEEYTGPVEGTLMGNQKTLVMTSDRPIALARELDKNPEVAINYTDNLTNNTMDMELKLPNPSPESIRTELRDGALTPYLVTTIVYV